MPHEVPLRPGDPGRVGRYRLTGRLEGIPSDDPIFVGTGPDGADVCVSILAGHWDAAARDRFAAEAAVAKRVPPFCAARVLDAGLDGDDAYLVSEYVRGASLLEVVATEGVREGTDLEALAIGMATGLASVHQAGLVHGSFGPQYVILGSDGPPRVVEFGITPPYGSATPSADMLAWAHTVVFAATGRPPSDAADLDVLPEHLREPVRQCLELESAERPAARAVVQFLLGGGPPPAGVLAEGSRRAAQADWAGAEPPLPRPAGPVPDRTRPPQAARPPAARWDTGRPPGLAPARGDLAGRPGLAHPRAGHHYPTGRDGTASARRQTGGTDTAPPGPAQHHAAGSKRSGRRIIPWLIGGAGVVIVVLAVFLVYLVLTGGSQPNRNRLSADTSPPSRPTASATPTVSPAASPGPVTPAAFSGTWSGQVTQPPAGTYTVTATFATGRSSGTISYTGTGISCSGNLGVTSASASKMIMSQSIIVGRKTCSNGTVSMTLTGANSIYFSFQSTPAAAGVLTRR